MYAYCIFCKAAKSELIAERIAARYHCRVLRPKLTQRKWIKGVPFDEVHDFLPGYLFLYADEPIQDFGDIYRMTDVYRVLGDQLQHYVLTGSDLAFSRALFAARGTLGHVQATCENGKIRLLKGTLGGLDGEIVRVDRRGRAEVRYSFDGRECSVWLGCELLDTDPSKDVSAKHLQQKRRKIPIQQEVQEENA